ncbi:MAG: hypothetical protein ACRDJI_05535 [Actinomycetota bacterium]
MDFIPYEQFGVNFVSTAVTPERVKAAVAEVAGDSFQIGPFSAGPAGVAVVKAEARIGAVEIEQLPGTLLTFEAMLPVGLDLEVRVAAVPHRYTGAIRVPLSLSVRTLQPLSLLIEVEPVVAGHVTVHLRSEGMSAGVLQRIGNIDGEVRKQVARVVNERLDSEHARASRRIDVAALIDKALDERGV